MAFIINAALLVVASADSQISVHSQDRLYTGFFALLVKFQSAVEIAVVGQSNGFHSGFFCFCHQLVDFRQSLQERVMAVSVKGDVGGHDDMSIQYGV